MLYLLNNKLSLEAKGLMSLILHLRDGGIKVDYFTAIHYIKESNTHVLELVRELQSEGYCYLDYEKDVVKIYEDNEIKE